MERLEVAHAACEQTRDKEEEDARSQLQPVDVSHPHRHRSNESAEQLGAVPVGGERAAPSHKTFNGFYFSHKRMWQRFHRIIEVTQYISVSSSGSGSQDNSPCDVMLSCDVWLTRFPNGSYRSTNRSHQSGSEPEGVVNRACQRLN